MTEYVVGKRDARHRKFLGWRVVDGDFQLDPNGHWYNVASDWHDLDAAKKATRIANEIGECDEDEVRIVRVFALEAPRRKALRELVAQLADDVAAPELLEALDNAKRILEAW